MWSQNVLNLARSSQAAAAPSRKNADNAAPSLQGPKRTWLAKLKVIPSGYVKIAIENGDL